MNESKECYTCHSESKLVEVIDFHNIDDEPVKEYFCVRCLIKSAL